jgi:hypothetical protein
MTSALVVSTALAWVAAANAAPFVVGRAQHVSRASTEDVPAGPPAMFDQGAGDVTADSLATGTGLVIKATFDVSITGNPKAAAIQGAINSAIHVYQALLKDPIAVSILFRYSTTFADGTPLGAGAVSVSESPIYILPWSTVVDALKADATSAHDAMAKAHLPGNPLTASVEPSSANGRAIGLDTPPGMFANGRVGAGGQYDGIVTLNAGEMFAFVRPPSSGTVDAQRSLEHEIDEVLGMGSYLPRDPNLRPEDLFSWSSPGTRNITASGTRYFSLDGGSTNLVGLNQNQGGDLGDWLSGACPQANPFVQNAFSCAGQASDVTATSPEGIALDVIGYDLSASTPQTPTHSSTTTTLPCSELPAATDIRAAIEAQCDCAGAPDHGAYVRCATQIAKSAFKSGTLSKQCKAAVVKCAARSTCGKSGFVTCCRTTAKGQTKCSIKRDAAHCKAPKHGTACPGQQPSCCDACGSGGCVAPSAAP